MNPSASNCEPTPRENGWRMIVAALLVAGGVLLASAMAAADVPPMAGAGVLAVAGLAGAWLLRPHAAVAELPLLCAGVVGCSVLVATLIDGSGSIQAAGGGAIFMAVLAGATSRNRASGLAASAILAGAVVLSTMI